MSETQISADDIARWETLDDIAASLEKRGLEPRPTLNRENGFENELLIEIEENKYIALIDAAPGDEPSDYNKFQSSTVPTTFVSTRDFHTFSIIRRKRIIGGDKHGRLDRQKFSFDKEQITSGDRYSALDKLNDIEYGDDSSLNNLFDTRQVVDEFYEGFESIRTDLVAEVEGIPDDRGDAKQRYVQVTLNRLIFLHFIQEKGLLGAGEDDYLLSKHDEFAADGDVQTDFYEPLFFKALAEEGFQSRKFDRVPYLNGGLFSKTQVEQEFENARLGADAAESDDLYREILEFLDSWNWNVDERLDVVEPKNLSPAVLGHIFEQSVNQKEMGAYYTPEEITSFMTRESIHPRTLDAVNEATGADYEEIDAIFGLDEAAAQGESGDAVATDGGAITQQAAVDAASADHVETLYFDVLKYLHVLDPAVGSGAFLLAAEDVLLDIYLHAIEYFEQLYEEQPFGVSERVKDELDAINKAGSKTLYAKREIILNNLYGVDIDNGAVEICKLRLWLSMVADIKDDPSAVDPLPNIDFNIRQGNSLIGFTEPIETSQNGDALLNNYGAGIDESVREMYEDIIEAVNRHQQSRTASAAVSARNEAEELITTHSAELDDKILGKFQDAGADDTEMSDVTEFDPFHWVIEFAPVYARGGFDVVIGNPPWDQLRASRDDYFPRFDEQFRSRMPSDKNAKQEELLADDEIAAGWERYQERIEKQMRYFTDGDEYNLQKPVVAGRQDPNENNLSALFLERIYNLITDGGYVAQVLPNVIFNGSFSKDLRMKMLNDTDIKALVGFENTGIFPDLHGQFRFTVTVFNNGGRTEAVPGIFDQRDLSILQEFDQRAIEVPRQVLIEYSNEARTFPNISTEEQLRLLKRVIEHPRLGDKIEVAWNVTPERELDRARASNRFVEDSDQGDYPVYGGANIHQFVYDDTVNTNASPPSLWSVEEDQPEDSAKYRVRERSFNSGELKKAIYLAFNGQDTSKSQKAFVNDLLEEYRGEPLQMSDVLPDFTEYRVVYRDIAKSTDERSMIATVIPKGVVCVHTVQTISPYEINISEEDLSDIPLHSAYNRAYDDEELFVIVGLLNSIPFDYLMRMKVDGHVVRYKFNESQLPRLVEGDEWFGYIWKRAARLNCYRNAFFEMRERLGGIETVTDPEERKEIRAEIDAAAFHAYGIEESEVEFMLDDFYHVDSPQMMDDAYFEMVLEKYRELSDDQPAGD